MYTQDLELKLTTIEPEYSDKPLLGHFKLTFGVSQVAYELVFASLIKYKYEKDDKLKQYIRNIDSDDFYTTSDIIKEFYSLGLPVDEWVEEYIEDVKKRMSAFSALIRLFQHLKTFGDDERTI